MKFNDFLKNIFQKYKKDEITFIGLGNPYRSDDGVGIEFINRIREDFNNSYTEFDNMDEVILNLMKSKNPGLLLFIDCSDFKGTPGEIRITTYDEIEDYGKHFHKIPIKLYMKLLIKENKQTFLIGIQPETLDSINEPKLSDVVSKSLTQLFGIIKDNIVSNSTCQVEKP
ncbi:MAG: hydrogenase maturation protease [Candidatus Cloacimonetes bacterium]|nr:hydrogenase maturation protease [Candidatus Cloacimonadota bacterium]